MRARRLRLGLSQSELSRRSGVNQATISQLENGIRGASWCQRLEAIADALDMTLAELVSDGPKARRAS